MLHVAEQLEETVQRGLVTAVENLFFVLEAVVEISLVHVQRAGDFLHRRTVISEPAERFRGALENFYARVGATVGAARVPSGTGRACAVARPGWIAWTD